MKCTEKELAEIREYADGKRDFPEIHMEAFKVVVIQQLLAHIDELNKEIETLQDGVYESWGEDN